jgi:hypothetical protein
LLNDSSFAERFQALGVHAKLGQDLFGVLAEARRVEAPPVIPKLNRRPHLDP